MSLFCPSCAQKVKKEDEKCPACNFNYTILDHFYTSEKKEIYGLVNDLNKVLADKEQSALKKSIERFTRRFQNIFISVVLEGLEEQFDADSKSLWLINNAEFVDLPPKAEVTSGILIFVDTNKQNIAISFCDSLNRYLNKKETYTLQSSAYLHLKSAKYYRALKLILSNLEKLILKKCK